MKISPLLQSAGLGLLMGCSETAAPAWLNDHQCNMDAVRQSPPPFYIDEKGDAPRSEPSSDPTADTLRTWFNSQQSPASEYTFCIDPTSAHRSWNGMRYRSYAFQLSQGSRYFQPRPSTPPGMRLISQSEYDRLSSENASLKEKRNEHMTQFGIGAIGVLVGLLVGIGRVVEARRRNMIEMAKMGTFNEADWEGWLHWVLPTRFYQALHVANQKAQGAMTAAIITDDDHH